MWDMKCMIIPLIIRATGIVTNSLKKTLDPVSVKHSIYSLQKTAILWTSHIIRKLLQSKTWSLSGGDHSWFKRSTREKRPVTRHDIIIIIINRTRTRSNRPITGKMSLTIKHTQKRKKYKYIKPLNTGLIYYGMKLNVVSTVHFQMRCVQKSPTNAHKLLNSLFLKYPYMYFGGLTRKTSTSYHSATAQHRRHAAYVVHTGTQATQFYY
jgi:hypothetical protein